MERKDIYSVIGCGLSTVSINAAGIKFVLKSGVAPYKVENSNGEKDKSVATDRRYPFADDNATTFTGGICAKIDLKKGFGIYPEIMFHQVSGRISREAVDNGKSTSSYSVRTISIPIMMRYSLKLPIILPPILTGPVVGFKLQSSYVYALKAASVQIDRRAGIGAMIKDIVEVSASYNYGLNNFS